MLHELYESTLTLHLCSNDETNLSWTCLVSGFWCALLNFEHPSVLLFCFADVASAEHRLQGIILDISSNRLFKAVRVGEPSETRNHPFLKVKFANKGIDALNLSNMLNQISVQSKIPPCFQYKESPCISYSYTRSVASKIFNYKASLQQIDFDGLSQNPTPCSCCDSEFLCTPCGHIVTGELSIVRNQKLKDVLRTGLKCRETSHFHGIRILISSWTRVSSMPDGGPRKRNSKSTLLPSGLSRSPMFWNVEFEGKER